jgi:hypothetical protein
LARALIVACGCRGRALGGRLARKGWSLRGSTRDPAHLPEIEAAGIEAAVADPDRPGTLLDLVGDVTVVHWLLGSAEGEAEELAEIHGPRLERLIERLVDSPLRGFVYEAAGTVPGRFLQQGRGDRPPGCRDLAHPQRGGRDTSGRPGAVVRGDDRGDRTAGQPSCGCGTGSGSRLMALRARDAIRASRRAEIGKVGSGLAKFELGGCDG